MFLSSTDAAVPVHDVALDVAQIWNLNLKKVRLRLAQVSWAPVCSGYGLEEVLLQQWLPMCNAANMSMNLSQVRGVYVPQLGEGYTCTSVG